MKDRGRKVDWALFALGIVALWAIPHRISGDGEIRYESLARLLRGEGLVVPRYSLVAPLFAVPLHLLGKLAGDPRTVTAYFNVALFTGALGLVARELQGELAPARRRATLLLLVYASMFPAHIQVFYGETFTALSVTLGVLWLSRAKTTRGALGGWIAIVLGGVNAPAAIVGVAAIAVRTTLRTRRLTHLLAPVATVALSCLENYVTRGSLFATGYENDVGFKTAMPYSGLPGFSYPFVLGLLAILLSFGKGLVFFTPGLFVPIAHGTSERLRWVHRTLLWFVVGLVFVYARWWAWYGGSFWGPRFFLTASVPAALALGSHIDRERSPSMNALFLGVLGFSFWVGVNGLVFDQNGLDVCFRDSYALESLCHFTPELSPLFHPFVDFASAVPAKTRPLALGVCAWWAIAFTWLSRGTLRSLGRQARAALARTLLGPSTRP